MLKLNINGVDVAGADGQTILDVARDNNIDIPSLCHDERVEMFGACGLCTVEVEGNPRLLRSCCTYARDGMVVHTNTERIIQNRKTALELLLSDHLGDCLPPCTLKCPAQTYCQGYVGLIANGAYDEAYALIKERIPLPASIGRVCPHPCEEACRRKLVEEPVSIMALKRFVSDLQLSRGEIHNAVDAEDTGKRVAVVGGGPGGLSAAYFLRMKGHDVDVYDAMPLMGGMLRYGIPEYRLPKQTLQEEIDAIARMGVKMHNGVRIGRDISLEELQKKSDAVVVAIGAWSSMDLNCPGEDLDGVHGGIEFLWNISGISSELLRRRVAIVGGGNTAMDACRTAARSGASAVYNVYRRTRKEMPAEESEIQEAEEEGVIFKHLTNPIEIIGENGKVKSIRLQIMELGEPDASGRRRPVPALGKEETIDVDIVIKAIGQKPNTPGFERVSQTKWDTIIADAYTFQTNVEGVFAVGDASNDGAGIAIEAIGEARRAAEMIDRRLRGEPLNHDAQFLVESEKTADDFAGVQKQPRARMIYRGAGERRRDFSEISSGFRGEEARKEASRCLECGCIDFFECKLLSYASQYQVQPNKYGGAPRKRARDDDHPFIKRNPDKCVLCGLCVRICDEVTGSAAIGLVNRGFDTLVRTAFDDDLREAGCISCGQCAHVCPTGALTVAVMAEKQVPLCEHKTESVCAFCSAGCKTILTSAGSQLLRCLPSSDKNALLCMNGRFGFGEIGRAGRLTTPLIRGKGGMAEASFEEAVSYIDKSLRFLQNEHGNDCVAVAISGRSTNEEAFLIKEYAEKVLKTRNVFSFGQTDSGLAGVLGRDASTAALGDLESAGLIVAVAPELGMHRSVAAMRIRRAVRKGAKLMLLSADGAPADCTLSDIAVLNIGAGGDLSALEQIVKLLSENGKGNDHIDGHAELPAGLAGAPAGGGAGAAAGMIKDAEKVIFIYEKHNISAQAAGLIANIAALSGHAGDVASDADGSGSGAISAGSSEVADAIGAGVASGAGRVRGDGIIQLLPEANSQGLINLGVGSREDYLRAAADGGIRGMLIFGEDINYADIRDVDFLAVQDLHMTETARQANVVLPAVSFAETSGSYTSADNKVQTFNAAVKSPVSWDNIRQIKALAGLACVELSGYAGPDAHSEAARKAPRLSGSVRLAAKQAGVFAGPGARTNGLSNSFAKYVKERNLI